MQGAPPLAPVPGKAREFRKRRCLRSTVAFCLGFSFFFSNGSSPSDYSMGFDTIWVVGQVALDCIRSTI